MADADFSSIIAQQYDTIFVKINQLSSMLLQCTGEAFEPFNESLKDDDKHAYLCLMSDLAHEIKSALTVKEVSHD